MPPEVSRPWWLAPPRRLRAGSDDGVLTLHTLQSAEAYDALRATGRLTGDVRYAEAAFAPAYRWMRRAMDARVGPASGMVWLWADPSRRFLARQCRWQRGDVLLTVEMPRADVVLSQHQSWHLVLNGYLNDSGSMGEGDGHAGWPGVFDLADRDEPCQLQATVNEVLWEQVVRVCRVMP